MISSMRIDVIYGERPTVQDVTVRAKETSYEFEEIFTETRTNSYDGWTRRPSNVYVFRLKSKRIKASATTKASAFVKQCETIQDWDTTQKIEGKRALVHAMNAQNGQQRYSPSHAYPRHKMVASGQIYILAALLHEKELTVPFEVDVSWTPTAGQDVLEKRKISYPWRPARSAVHAPPYRIRYSGIVAVDIRTTEEFILMDSKNLWTTASKRATFFQNSQQTQRDILGDRVIEEGRTLRSVLGKEDMEFNAPQLWDKSQ